MTDIATVRHRKRTAGIGSVFNIVKRMGDIAEELNEIKIKILKLNVLEQGDCIV